MCAEPTKTAAARGERLPPPGLELRAAAHRVLELGAVRLDRVAQAARGADRAAEQDVVREHEVGRCELAQRGRVRLDVALALLEREVLEQPRLEPLVAVEHEHGQQAAGSSGRTTSRAAEVERLRMPLLADDGDVVPGPRPLARQRPRVDVRARSAEQVAVPDQDPHGAE